MKTVYEVQAVKDGRWWTLSIPALTSPSPRGGDHRIVARGQASAAAAIEGEAIDIIEMWTGEDASSIAVNVVYGIDQSIREELEAAKEKDRQGRRALDDAASLRRHAVERLLAEGLSQPDTAQILGISRQRVQQLAATK